MAMASRSGPYGFFGVGVVDVPVTARFAFSVGETSGLVTRVLKSSLRLLEARLRVRSWDSGLLGQYT
jgi:hypothetical protein